MTAICAVKFVHCTKYYTHLHFFQGDASLLLHADGVAEALVQGWAQRVNGPGPHHFWKTAIVDVAYKKMELNLVLNQGLAIIIIMYKQIIVGLPISPFV